MHKLLILCASFVLIFNQCTLEYLLFPESAVMCFSLLCMCLAAFQTIENKKHKYLKTFLLLLLVVTSYQGLILAFPVVFLFLQFINMKNTENKNKAYIIKEIVKFAFIVILAIAVESSIVVIMNNALGKMMHRTVKLINFEAALIRLKYSFANIMVLFIDFMNMLPKFFLPIVLLISTVTMCINKNTRKFALQNIFLIIVTGIESMTFIFMFDSGQSGRTNWVIGTLWGISLMYLVIKFSIEQKNSKFIAVFVICSFLFNSFMLLQNSAWHTAANAIDKSDGYAIKTKIEMYESQTNNKITKFAYIYDYNPSQSAPGIKPIGSLSERALSCSWSIVEAVRYHTGRKLKEVAFPYDLYFEKMEAIDYKGFYDKQMYLQGDTLYIVVY